VNAAEIVVKLGEVGLEVGLVNGALEVRGPEDVRVEFLPMVAAAAKQIKALILAGGVGPTAPKCHGTRDARCPLHQVIHGHLSADPCSQCGSDDWLVSVVGTDKLRRCARCVNGS
jgi:IMP dehydrogenase/GMP reductase